MSYFMEIIAIQPPIDIGTDETNRSMFSTNYRASVSLNSGVIERELISYLQGLGICTLRVGLVGDTLYGSKAIIPSGDGPWILIKLSGGYGPRFTHDDAVESNIMFQVAIWAKSQDIASAKSWHIHDELNGKRDVEVNVI